MKIAIILALIFIFLAGFFVNLDNSSQNNIKNLIIQAMDPNDILKIFVDGFLVLYNYLNMIIIYFLSLSL
jgi:hypothetical protein